MNLDIALRRLTELANSTLALLPGLVVGLIVFGVFLLVGRLISAGLERAVRLRNGSPGLGIVLGRVGHWLTGLLGFLVGAAIAFPGVGASDLFSVLGIGGVAIGFAFRDIFQNLLAGILILLTRPFRIGDQIVTGGYEGTVEDIQVRATTIRSYDNRRAVIPNSVLFGDKVLVNTAYDKRRLQVRVGIGYGDDIAHAKRVILDAVGDTPDILTDPAPQVWVAELGDSAVQLDVMFWIDPPIKREVLGAVDAVLERVKPALQQAGVDLPYPTRQVLFHDQTETSDGDRARQREGWPARGQDPRPRWRVLHREDGEQDGA